MYVNFLKKKLVVRFFDGKIYLENGSLVRLTVNPYVSLHLLDDAVDG